MLGATFETEVPMDETDEGKDEGVSEDARKEKVPGTTIENIVGGGG